MPLFRWITRLLSASVRETPKTDPYVRLSLTRLEERRVLNADFALVGDQLQLTNFSGDSEKLIVQETTNEYHFILAEEAGSSGGGGWVGTDGSGITASGDTLIVLKSAIGPASIAAILIDDSGEGSDLHIDFQTVDLSELADGLIIHSVDAVTQAASTSLTVPQIEISANSVDLSNPNNDFGTLAANVEGNINISDLNDLVIGIGSSGITTGGNLLLVTGSNLTVNQAIDADGAVTVSNTGLFTTAADGDIRADGGFAQNGTGTNLLAGDITTNGTDIRFDTAVTLAGNVAMTTGTAAGNIEFASTLDSAANDANALTVTAGTGNVTFAGAVGAAPDGALGSITINSATDVTFSSTVETTGNVTQVAGSGTTTFHGTSGTGIGGALSLTTNAIALNSATVTTVGPVDLTAQNAISINSGSGLDAGASTIAIAANQDGTGTEGFRQADGTTIQTTNATEDAIRITVGGSGGAAIAALQTGDGGRVTIVAGGPISDTNGDAMNITAASASLTAAGGIGSVDELETTIDVLAFTNTGSGDVRIANTGDLAIGTVGTLSGGSAGTGSITVQADGGIWILDNIETDGGILGSSEGIITVEAATSIFLEEGVVVRTGTGQMTGFATVNEAGESVRTPPPVEVVVFPVDQGGSNVNSLGVGYIDVTVNDPGVVNYQIEVDWGDRTILIYRPEDAFSGGDDFVSENTYRLRYAYQPDNIPDPNNPAAPIPVKVTIRYDGREVADSDGGFVRGIVFREGGVELSTTVETELTVPGTGLFGFIKVTESVIVPVELRPTTPVLYVLSEVAPAIRQEEMFALQAAAADQASISAMRIFFRRVDAAGKEGPDVELPTDAFDRGLDNLFRKFPNGHYRVYLQEANSQRIRLIREIHVYQGRIVPADFRDDIMERQPGSGSDERPNDPASEPPVDPADDPADEQPADPASGEQNGTGAAGAAALAAWSARRRIERLDRALEQAGQSGTKFGRRRRRADNELQT